MDRLSNILQHFSMSSEVFFTGEICGIQHFNSSEEKQLMSEQQRHGEIHLLKSGKIIFQLEGDKPVTIDKPAVMFIPAHLPHQIIPQTGSEVEVVCAKVHYGGAGNNPLVKALPPLVLFELAEETAIEQTADWLFKEAFEDHCGRRPMIENLCNIFMILVLRKIIESGEISHGMMAGLADSRLAKVLTAIHDAPEKPWNLPAMAELALMSRSRFAEEFHRVVGQTPKEYVVFWRLMLAQQLLKEGHSVTWVAQEVGYENGSVLARVFKSKLGVAPKDWLKRQLTT